MQEVFKFDWLGGPVYKARDALPAEAAGLRHAAGLSYLVSVLIDGQDRPCATSELRQYFALNLAQALARAAELQVRLRELETPATVVGIRPTTNDELDAFFDAIDRLEERMPGPVTETGHSIRTGTQNEQGGGMPRKGGARQ